METKMPAEPNAEADSTNEYTPSAYMAMMYAIRPNVATIARANQTFDRSVILGASGTITLWLVSAPQAKSALSTVDKIAETSAPANTMYNAVGSVCCAIAGNSCSGSSSPGSNAGPASPMPTGIMPTMKYMPAAAIHALRAVAPDRAAKVRETNSCAKSDPMIGTDHASSATKTDSPSGTKLKRSGENAAEMAWLSCDENRTGGAHDDQADHQYPALHHVRHGIGQQTAHHRVRDNDCRRYGDRD